MTFNKTESMKRCLKYRKKVLDMSQKVSALHGGGAFSATEMIDLSYFGLMRRDNKGKFIDTFLMSKGHSCLIQYIILENLKILTTEDLELYCKAGGRLGCHPDYGVPGIEASTGSLGHGMGLAVGMFQADKIKKVDKKIYVILSDGELQEGSTWENMMMGANLNAKNIIALLDHNGSQSFGVTKDTHPKFYPIKEKITSFGWECEEANGHDVDEMYQKVINRSKTKPFMLICNTVKGKGVSFMENKPVWHYRSPNKEEYKIAIKELKEIGK